MSFFVGGSEGTEGRQREVRIRILKTEEEEEDHNKQKEKERARRRISSSSNERQAHLKYVRCSVDRPKSIESAAGGLEAALFESNLSFNTKQKKRTFEAKRGT
jgi:hypothetical protein